jgi:hypothetical protein
MATLSNTAALLLSSLEEAVREDGSQFLRLSDFAPDWGSDVIRDAHNGELPNDSRYALIRDALEALKDGAYEDEEKATEDVCSISLDLLPCRTADLLAWFADHCARLAACDDALSDGRVAEISTFEILSEGWRADCEATLHSLISSLEEERAFIFNPDTDCRILLSDSHGICIPQTWTSGMTEEDCKDFSVSWEDVQACQSGPDCEQYWDAWQAILDSAEWEEDGEMWRLVQSSDLFAIRADAVIPEDWFC